MNQTGRSGSVTEVEDALQLPLHTRHVVTQGLAVEKVALLAAAAGVAHHPGGATGQDDRAVSGELEASQHHLAEQVAGVQRVGRGIEPDIDADRPFGETGREHTVSSRG